MTDTYALIGWPLEFSLSPAMHNAAFRTLGIDAEYVVRPTEDEAALEQATDALRRGELAGANVTTPHKIAVRVYLRDESETVITVGAVNTIVRDEVGLRGENTDVVGFRALLREVGMTERPDGHAVVLGAGGAASAAVAVLIEGGYSATVLNRSSARSAVLVGLQYRQHGGAVLSTGPLNADTIVAEAQRADLLVNATPVGAPHITADSLWPADQPIPESLTVVDLVAWPLETPLVRQARADGARAVGGLEMLVGQAAAALALWTGHEAPTDVMRTAAKQAATERTAGGGSANPAR